MLVIADALPGNDLTSILEMDLDTGMDVIGGLAYLQRKRERQLELQQEEIAGNLPRSTSGGSGVKTTRIKGGLELLNGFMQHNK